MTASRQFTKYKILILRVSIYEIEKTGNNVFAQGIQHSYVMIYKMT